MDDVVLLLVFDSCEYLFLMGIGELEVNCLWLVIEEGQVIGEFCLVDFGNGCLIEGVCVIEIIFYLQWFELVWNVYISYVVYNEFYQSWDDFEVWSGNFFCCYSCLKFFDYLDYVIFVDVSYLGLFMYYQVICQDYVIDIVVLQLFKVCCMDFLQLVDVVFMGWFYWVVIVLVECGFGFIKVKVGLCWFFVFYFVLFWLVIVLVVLCVVFGLFRQWNDCMVRLLFSLNSSGMLVGMFSLRIFLCEILLRYLYSVCSELLWVVISMVLLFFSCGVMVLCQYGSMWFRVVVSDLVFGSVLWFRLVQWWLWIGWFGFFRFIGGGGMLYE